MSTSTRGARPADGYHHGDLRRALLAAAFEVLAQHGLDALSLREVARRAGVSHAAPYHHFADKAALIGALVEAGFEDLTAALRAAADAPGLNLERLARTGVAYVRYAVDHPATFRLLFRPELRASAAPAQVASSTGNATAPTPTPTPAPDAIAPDDVTPAGRAAYAVLLEGVLACLASGEVAGDAEALTLASWCGVHGLATLLLDGPLRQHAGPAAEVEALARTVTAVLASGLIPRVEDGMARP